MSKDISPAELLEAIQPLVKDDKLPCKDALALADRLSISPARIGKICNDHEIRIVNCQLGCFGAGPKRRD